MSVTDQWNSATPDGTVEDANTIAANIRKNKRQTAERMSDLGVTNWETAIAGQVVVFGRVSATKQLGGTYFDNGNSGAAKTIDLDTGPGQKLTLTGNCTITLTNAVAGMSTLIALKQDGTGSRTVTWPATVIWGGGVAPVLTTTAGRTDLIGIFFDGAKFFGTVIGLNYNI